MLLLFKVLVLGVTPDWDRTSERTFAVIGRRGFYLGNMPLYCPTHTSSIKAPMPLNRQ